MDQKKGSHLLQTRTWVLDDGLERPFGSGAQDSGGPNPDPQKKSPLEHPDFMLSETKAASGKLS